MPDALLVPPWRLSETWVYVRNDERIPWHEERQDGRPSVHDVQRTARRRGEVRDVRHAPIASAVTLVDKLNADLVTQT